MHQRCTGAGRQHVKQLRVVFVGRIGDWFVGVRQERFKERKRMTTAQAKQIFATHMAAARKRKLAPMELKQLSEARQTLRRAARPAMNPSDDLFQLGLQDVLTKHGYRRKYADVKSYNDGWKQGLAQSKDVKVPRRTSKGMRTNPGKPVMIYGKVLRIEAQKTQNHICDAECKKFNHRYFHDFTSSPKMYGLPDGSILIRH